VGVAFRSGDAGSCEAPLKEAALWCPMTLD
jgi:hypothetical protein